MPISFVQTISHSKISSYHNKSISWSCISIDYRWTAEFFRSATTESWKQSSWGLEISMYCVIHYSEDIFFWYKTTLADYKKLHFFGVSIRAGVLAAKCREAYICERDMRRYSSFFSNSTYRHKLYTSLFCYAQVFEQVTPSFSFLLLLFISFQNKLIYL